MELGLTAANTWNKYEVKTVTIGHTWSAYNPYTISSKSVTNRYIDMYYHKTNQYFSINMTDTEMTYPPDPTVHVSYGVTVKWSLSQELLYGKPSSITPTLVMDTIRNHIICPNENMSVSYLITSVSRVYATVDSYDAYIVGSGTQFTIDNIGEKGDFVKEVVDASYVAYPQNGLKEGDIYYYEYKGVKTEQQQGSLVGKVYSDSPDTYPDNGIHTDGYWYIKI